MTQKILQDKSDLEMKVTITHLAIGMDSQVTHNSVAIEKVA